MYVYGNANSFNEGPHSTNIVNGSGNTIYAGDASNVTFNGNSNYASIGNYSNIWYYGSGNQGYEQYSSEVFLQGNNNYASTGSASVVEMWYNTLADGNHGQIGTYSLVVNESTGAATQLGGSAFNF